MALSQVWISYVLLLLVAAPPQTAQPATRPQDTSGTIWTRSYQDALKVADVQNRPVMLFFTASWCPWCHKMEDETLKQEDVVSNLRGIICVKVDVEKQRDLALAYTVSSLPRVFVINTHDEIVGDWLGYRDPEQFSELIAQIQPYLTTATGVRKVPEVARKSTPPAPPDQRATLDTNDPDQRINLIGHKDRAVRQRAIAALAKDGSACLPAVLAALEHDYLGVRIAAWKVIRGLAVTDLEFDPWAPRAERERAARTLQGQLNGLTDRSD